MQRRSAVALSLAALAAAFALLVLAGRPARADDKRVIDREVDLAGARSLTVRAGAVDVRVRNLLARRQAHPGEAGPSAAAHGAAAHVHLELHGDSAAVANVTLDVSREGDSLVITVTEAQNGVRLFRTSSSLGGTCEVSLAAEIDLALRTGSGSIEVDGAPRAIAARSGSGEIEISDPHGSVDAHTGSGNIVVHGAPAALTMHTGSGNVDAALRAGWTGSGVQVQTGSGNVRLAVPAGLRGALVTHTGSGSVTDEAHVTGAPSPVLQVRTGSGDVHIVAAR